MEQDQFGTVLAVAPTFTWTATGGTITTGGVYTADATAGPFVVTATTHGKNGTAAVTITPAPIGYNWIMDVLIFVACSHG